MRWPTSRIAVACGAAFVVLTVLVLAGSTDALDVATRDLLRPDDGWGPEQNLTRPVIDLLQPVRMFAVLAVVGTVLSIRARSPRPLVFTGAVAVAATAVTLLVKVLVARPDPHHDMSGIGGAYPSGHIVALLVCLGAIALALHAEAPWWSRLAWWLVAVAGSVMAAALLLTAAHWLTDVLGGVLIAVAVLAWASRLRPRRPTGHEVTQPARPGAR